jgi:hypothetical protein
MTSRLAGRKTGRLWSWIEVCSPVGWPVGLVDCPVGTEVGSPEGRVGSPVGSEEGILLIDQWVVLLVGQWVWEWEMMETSSWLLNS